MDGMQEEYDFLFKILLVGDSGVGKTCILTRFTDDVFSEDTKATLGVDFKVKHTKVGDLRCKLSVWDTAGQERFRTLTSTYYRGAQGIIFVYDVTRRDSFEALESVWMKEVELYSNVEDAVCMVVANKVDLAHAREVQPSEGHELAQRHGCLFAETSAKADLGVAQGFEELLLKVLDSPALLQSSSDPQTLQLRAQHASPNDACSC